MYTSTNPRQIGLKLLLSLAFAASHFLWFSYPAQGQAGAKLSGVVYYGGGVMPDFPVSLYSPDRVLQTETDKAGRFEFSGLPRGTYDLQARFWGVEGTIYGIRMEGKDLGPLTVEAKLVESWYPLDPDCGRTFWVSYKQNAITDGGHTAGVLLTYPTVPNRLLVNVRIDLTAATGSHHRISRHADERGNFEFQNVPPGRYSLLAHYRGYWKVQSTIWVTREDTAVIKIILHKHGHPAICE